MGGSTAGTIVVAGGANIDIGGQSQGPLAYRDSNPGTVTVSLGGVGRNIAHNLLLPGLGHRPHRRPGGARGPDLHLCVPQ